MLWSFHGFLLPGGLDPETVGFGCHRDGGGEQVMNSSYLHSLYFLYFLCKDKNINNLDFQADLALGQGEHLRYLSSCNYLQDNRGLRGGSPWW